MLAFVVGIKLPLRGNVKAAFQEIRSKISWRPWPWRKCYL